MSRSQSTPQSSQIIWLEARVKELEEGRDELAAQVTAFALERSIRQMTEKRNLELLGQVAELAQQVEVMREALEGTVEYTALLDDFTQAAMRAALALPSTAAEILKKRDARVLRDAAADLVAGSLVGWPFISDALLKMADEMESGK